MSGPGALILSNNHVLANEDRSRNGDRILQPGAYDHGRNPADVIGALVKGIKLKRRGANRLDCAVAALQDRIRVDARLLRGLGRLAGVGHPTATGKVRVAKVGRATRVTRGRVTAFELDDLVVGYDIGNLRFGWDIAAGAWLLGEPVTGALAAAIALVAAGIYLVNQ